ncbi:MAG: hypothetical protein EBR18_07635, partial [Betaproteobacteria bacterium]|nr:hypothetical protein [Betaproteobacteria bacterium]
PKLQRLTQALRQRGMPDAVRPQDWLPLLTDTRTAEDTELPDTGVPLATERALSATFIRTPDYGTRACSIVHMRGQQLDFWEQEFGADGAGHLRFMANT